MARRSTRDEAIAAENQAVRLFVRGYSDGEIAVALTLSESEARRKRQLGMERRRQEAAETSAWSRLEAELGEAHRVAYRDHDEAPKGSAARIGSLKLIVELSTRRARLYGLDLEQGGPTQQPVKDNAPGAVAVTDFPIETREQDARTQSRRHAMEAVMFLPNDKNIEALVVDGERIPIDPVDAAARYGESLRPGRSPDQDDEVKAWSNGEDEG
jgi:hypothetical protein